MEKIIVFSKSKSFSAGFEVFTSKRKDLKKLDGEQAQALYYDEESFQFIKTEDFSLNGLYLIYDRILADDFNALMKGYDQSEFFVLRHSMPDFPLDGFAKVLEGRHELLSNGGKYYPKLIDILEDADKEKAKRFFRATFEKGRIIGQDLDQRLSQLYETTLRDKGYWDKDVNNESVGDPVNNRLLIWDNHPDYVSKMCHQMAINMDDVLFSIAELKSYSSIADKKAIVVLLESNLENKKRSDFYGLEIVTFLRKELRYKGLILVYSTLGEQEIREMVPDYELLFTSGIQLVQISKSNRPLTAEEIEKLLAEGGELSDDLLDDICYNVLDGRGKLHELIHNLKNELGNLKEGTISELIIRIEGVLSNYELLFSKEVTQDNLLEFRQIFRLLQAELINDVKLENENKDVCSYNNGSHLLNKYSNQLVLLAPANECSQESHSNEMYDWEVLYLEDTQGIRDKVQSYFEARKVKCHTASSEEEVFDLLKKHQEKIALFLTDIRLLHDDGRWWNKQGYDIIREVGNKSVFPLVYVVLTSKKGIINKMVQKKQLSQPLWFSKDDVIDNQRSFNIFFDVIKPYAEKFAHHGMFKPDGKVWANPVKNYYTLPLGAYYKAHKESPDYQEEEKLLNQKTLDFIEGIGAPEEWTCKLRVRAINEFVLNRFINTKLLGRRIMLALVASEEATTRVSLYNKMTGKNIEEFDHNVQALFNRLALPSNLEKLVNEARDSRRKSEKNLGILIEELDFLNDEFFEEQTQDNLYLGLERKKIEDFIQVMYDQLMSPKFEEVFDPVTEAKTFLRVKAIMDKKGYPKIQRLDEMFAELKDLDERVDGKLIVTANMEWINSIENINIKRLLSKYCWI